MLALHTRNHWAIPRSVPGLVKVCCMGDSMMHGAGVAPREALPARLEHHLNAGNPDRLFLVENWGVRQTNLWHAFHLFRDQASSGGCDLAVFSVCANDCNLFETVVRYPYPAEGEEQGRWWRNLQAEFETTLVNLRDLSVQLGIPVLLMWIGMRADDGPSVDLVARMCERAGLPFVDGLRFLNTMGYGDCDPRLWATPVDAHLSALALDLLARHAAVEMERRLCFPWRRPESSPSASTDIPAVADGIAELADEAAALRWWHDASLAKAVATRRFAARQERHAIQARIDAAAVDLGTRYRRWYECAAWEAVLDSLKADGPLLAEIDAIVRGAMEVMYCAARFPETPLADDVRRDAGRRRLLDLPIPDRASWMARMAPIDAALAAIESRAKGMSDLKPMLALLSGSRSRVLKAIEELDGLGDPATLVEPVLALAHWASNEIGRCYGRLERISRRVERLQGSADAAPAFYTQVELYVRCPDLREKRLFWYIELGVEYAAPSFTPIVDGHLLILDGRPHLYRLEVPLLLQGDLTLTLLGSEDGLCPRGLGMVERIVLSSRSGSPPMDSLTVERRPEWEGARTARIPLRGALLT